MTERTLVDLVIYLLIASVYFWFVVRCMTAATWTRRAMRETDFILEQRMKRGILTEPEIVKAFGCLVPAYKRICFNPFITSYEKAFPWLVEWQKKRPLP